MLSEGKNLPAISHGANVAIIARFRDAKTVFLWAVPQIIMTKIILVGNDINVSAIIVVD